MSLYGHFYRDLLVPGYERLRGRQTSRFWREAEARQWQSRADILAFQAGELQRLLEHAATHSPWHKARFEQLEGGAPRRPMTVSGPPPAVCRLQSAVCGLPTMSKNDILAHRAEMRTTQCPGRVYEHRTGGSTGTPLRFDVNYPSYEWRCAVSLRGYGWAGCCDGERQFYVWGAPIGIPPLPQRLKTRTHNALLRRRIFSSFGFSEPALDECLRQIQRFRPKTIVGYTNALYLLAQHILNQKPDTRNPALAGSRSERDLKLYPEASRRLCYGAETFSDLRALITAAEGVNTVQRETIERAFGAPVFASYGSREFMLIAMECEQHHGLHVSADNLLVEVVRPDGTPCAEGEIGEILVTDLHNYALPFIRYKIGDLGVASSRACPCGRGLPLLERIEGRVLDAIRTPDGRIVPGEFFPHLMKEFDAVRQFQVVQKQLDQLEINLVLTTPDPADQLQRMEREIKRTLGDSIRLNLNRVDKIPETASGKFRVTVSELETAAGSRQPADSGPPQSA